MLPPPLGGELKIFPADVLGGELLVKLQSVSQTGWDSGFATPRTVALVGAGERGGA